LVMFRAYHWHLKPLRLNRSYLHMTVTWQDFEATEVQTADTSIFLRRFGSGPGVCSETEEAAPFQERVLGNLPLTLASLLQHECWPHVHFGSLADIP
jgi:hypothetical protein